MTTVPFYVPGDRGSESPQESAFKAEPYRAAYWRASNRTRGGILLTGKPQQGLSTDTMHMAARAAADRAGLLLGGGSIVIIGADGNDERRA